MSTTSIFLLATATTHREAAITTRMLANNSSTLSMMANGATPIATSGTRNNGARRATAALAGVVMIGLLRVPLVLGFVGGRHQVGRSSSLISLRSSNNQSSGNNGRGGNPFTSMIGDMAGSIFGKSTSVSSSAGMEQALQSLDSSSWEDVRAKLASLQTPQERRFRHDLPFGYGVGSPLHNLRLFTEDNKEEDVRVTFYRDSASWCPYCQKVWLTLEEKKIPYKVERINMSCYGDKPPSFLRIQPGGQIPVAIIDGRVYGQSNDILQALEDGFGDHKSLVPKDGSTSTSNRQLLQLERQIFGAWLYWLKSDSASSKREFMETLDVVESVLQSNTQGDFFVGNDITQVDVQFVPFMERMCASLLFFKGFQLRYTADDPNRKYPAINAWFDAMETLPSYRLTKSDYYTHSWDLPPQLGGCTYEPGGQKYEAAINGERSIADATRGSWELPLEPHNGGIEPDWAWAMEGAQREAVERLSANANAIVKFAARGAGKKGMPPAMAPLSDPRATSNDAVVPAVDAVLRIVCSALLQNDPDSQKVAMRQLATTIATTGGDDFVQAVVDSLVYFRDRIGVPRDMTLPAARELRAYINWPLAILLDCQK